MSVAHPPLFFPIADRCERSIQRRENFACGRTAPHLPSPLAGEGISMYGLRRMGEGGCLQKMPPHPFFALPTPTCPLPRGERANAAWSRRHTGSCSPSVLNGGVSRISLSGLRRMGEGGCLRKMPPHPFIELLRSRCPLPRGERALAAWPRNRPRRHPLCIPNEGENSR
jgi:hypothetical protein